MCTESQACVEIRDEWRNGQYYSDSCRTGADEASGGAGAGKAEVGSTPRRRLDAQRTAHARELLETIRLPAEDVAAKAGFGSVTALQVHLRAATGATSAVYRRSSVR
ncbi:helix-turn-helix domain-containing protein [Nocardia sp. R7R-8]|uniref:helix-turn-helix domain-containing protein n=1 Tax=Nocardia sp. R7R-8 TaxID=3459304 RepID=UPI00403D6F08